MWSFLADLLDLWSDRPDRAKGWLVAIGVALAVIAASLVLDRCGVKLPG